MDPIVAQFGTSALVVALVQYLKEATVLPWINQNSSRVNWLVGVVTAFMTALGLGYMFDSQSGVLTITGLRWDHIAMTLWSTLHSLGFQWLIYHGVVKKDGTLAQTPPPPVVSTGSTVVSTGPTESHKDNPLFKV